MYSRSITTEVASSPTYLPPHSWIDDTPVAVVSSLEHTNLTSTSVGVGLEVSLLEAVEIVTADKELQVERTSLPMEGVVSNIPDVEPL